VKPHPYADQSFSLKDLMIKNLLKEERSIPDFEELRSTGGLSPPL